MLIATPIATPVPPTTLGAGKGSGDTSFPVNTAIVIPVGVVIIIIIVVIVLILIFICYKWKSNNDNYDCEKNKTKKKKKEEWNKEGDGKDKTDGKEEILGKEDNGKNKEISRETETAGEETQTQGKSGIGINGTEQNVETGGKQAKKQDETKKLKKTDGKSANGTQQSVVRGEKKPKKAAPGPRNTRPSHDSEPSSSASQPPDRRKNTDPLNQEKIDPKTAQTSPSTQSTVYRPKNAAPPPPLDKEAKKPGQENRKGSQRVRTPSRGSRSNSGPQPRKDLTTKSSRPKPPTSKTKDSDTTHSLQQNALSGRTATKTTSTSGARSTKRAWS